MEIRPETENDIERIAEITRDAFDSDVEPRLIAAIRESEQFIPGLSLVAAVDGVVVGHVLFSGITVRSGDTAHHVLSLAPMAVVPSHQRQGIGSALVRRGIEECRRLKHPIIVLIGHPEYYPRFGFTPARQYGLELEFEVPDAAFMVLGLEPEALESIGGTVMFPPAFDVAT